MAAAIPPQIHLFADDDTFPNSRFPVLIFPAAVALNGRDPAAAFEALFEGNGWGGVVVVSDFKPGIRTTVETVLPEIERSGNRFAVPDSPQDPVSTASLPTTHC